MGLSRRAEETQGAQQLRPESVLTANGTCTGYYGQPKGAPVDGFGIFPSRDRDPAFPMKIPDRLTRMIDGVPDGASIILSVEDVKGWLSENGSGLEHDLTVEEVGKLFGRSPATIRAWIRAGRLDAYHFRGNEYRITRAALEEFQGQERNGGQ